MQNFTKLTFNPNPSTRMYVDINSCFATVEQQYNPKLRGVPVGIAPYKGDTGTIIAASIEAKKLGIKTGCKVGKAKSIYKNIVILEPDPPKYRKVHLELKKLLSDYTYDLIPKSIDEFSLNLDHFPAIKRGMFNVGKEIKQRIKNEIGEWITVSIGIAPNSFLAKTASNLQKPDGLREINIKNYISIYKTLELEDLCGISKGSITRLATKKIFTVLDMYNATPHELHKAFKSIAGYQWYLRLKGWEAQQEKSNRKSFGNSYALPKPFYKMEDLAPILFKLTEKTGHRIRKAGYKTKGIHVSVLYRDGTYWHKGKLLHKPIFDTRDIYKCAYKLLRYAPKKPVRILAESCYYLCKNNKIQLDMFDNEEKKERVVQAVDKINEKWGDFVIKPAKMLHTNQYAKDSIGFGRVKEL